MAELGARNAEREGTRAQAASLLLAMRAHERRVENLCKIVVPGIAWVGALVALVAVWGALSAHQLAAIMLGHIFFRAFARVYVNVVWLPRMMRELANRFPEFRTEIEDSFAKDDDD
jgi:hypothetical protein